MAALLGIDYGQKWVGIARGTTEARIASPLLTLVNDTGLQGQLQQLVQTEAAKTLVVGLPRGLDGQETAQTAAARAFGAKLAKSTGLPVKWQDEAATSLEAAKQLKQGKYGDIDSLAAALILQDYLDNL